MSVRHPLTHRRVTRLREGSKIFTPRAGGTIDHGSGKKYVVDENGSTIRLVRGDSASALVEITNHPPALVLLDIAMPVMIGDELLRHLRGNGFEELPVIVMTAGLHPERYRLAGADEVLPKPFDIDALIAAVKRYLSPH